MTHPQITVLVCSFLASYLLAAEFGFNLFQALLSFLVQLPFRAFILLFTVLNPIVQEASRRQRFTLLLRAWNFAIDCVVSGNQSVIFLLDFLLAKLGINDEVTR
jgi:hypothetical protein